MQLVAPLLICCLRLSMRHVLFFSVVPDSLPRRVALGIYPDGMVIVPASCTAALIAVHFGDGADAHVCAVADFKCFLIGFVEVALGVCASV